MQRASFNPLPWLMGALLFLMVFLAYRPAASAGFVWDDDDYVSRNPAVQDGWGLGEIWFHPTHSPQYYPVVFTTFWMQAQVGSGAGGFHEVNIWLHGVSAILLWRILVRLGVPGGFLAAMIFAVHPVMVESVAWVSERKNTLSLVFYLASLLAYLRFVRMDGSFGRRGWYGLALMFFLLALLSKTVTCSLPGAILLILWWKRGKLRAKDWGLMVPFFLLGVCGAVVTGYLEHSIADVGASGAEWNYSFAQRVLIAGRGVWFYLGKLVWPFGLSFVYPKWSVDVGVWWQWTFPVGVVSVIGVLFLMRRRIGRGALVAVLFFVGTLVPGLGFINVYPMRYTFVADHYQYHASIGVIVLASAGLVVKTGMGRQISSAGIPIGGIAIVLLFMLTVRWTFVYRDSETLWTDVVAKDPNCWLGWINLGRVAAGKRPADMAAAEKDFRRALSLAPGVADPHYNMGIIFYDRGEDDLAAAEFERVIALEPRPVDALDMLGVCRVRHKRVEDGIRAYRAALLINPRHTLAHFHLGVALRDQVKVEEALAEFLAAVKSDARFGPAFRELANCWIKRGEYEKAIEPLEKYLSLSPDDAEGHFDLGAAMMMLHREEEGREHLRRAVELKPELGERLRRGK